MHNECYADFRDEHIHANLIDVDEWTEEQQQQKKTVTKIKENKSQDHGQSIILLSPQMWEQCIKSSKGLVKN